MHSSPICLVILAISCYHGCQAMVDIPITDADVRLLLEKVFRDISNQRVVEKRYKYAESAGTLGVGYNLLKAVPHAARLGSQPLFGSNDAGVTMASVFRNTWSTMNSTTDFLLPDRVVFTPAPKRKRKKPECYYDFEYELITGIKAYQKLLLANVITNKPKDTDCKKTLLGKEYAGTKNHTITGKPCRRWGGSGELGHDRNYCRNLSDDYRGPYCFDGNTTRDLETCGLHFCEPAISNFNFEAAFLGPYHIETFGDKDQILSDYIYFEYRRICPAGHLALEVQRPEVQVSDDFRRAVCRLPEDPNQPVYTEFLDTFGTHVIVGVDIGKINLRRYDVERKDLNSLLHDGNTVTKIVTIYEDVSFKPSQYLTTDLHRLLRHRWRETALKYGAAKGFEWNSGSDTLPKVYAFELLGLADALESKYWTETCSKNETSEFDACCESLSWIQSNVIFALASYPTDKGVPMEEEISLFDDSVLAVPLGWPAGYYSLPAVANFCPEEEWHQGVLRHGTFSKNILSDDNHLAAYKTDSYVQQAFCTKGHGRQDGQDWPAGKYCINRYSGKCPRGLEDGFIWWNDRRTGINTYIGINPDGDYGLNINTRLEFCCRTDGDAYREIVLPTLRPFYLMKYADVCQQIKDMSVAEEWIFWDSNDFGYMNPRSWQMGGSHPRNDYYHENNKLYYCYYEPNNWKKDEAPNDVKYFADGKPAIK